MGAINFTSFIDSLFSLFSINEVALSRPSFPSSMKSIIFLGRSDDEKSTTSSPITAPIFCSDLYKNVTNFIILFLIFYNLIFLKLY